MKKSILHWLSYCGIFYVAQGVAASNALAISHYHYVEPSSNFTVGNQVYDASVSGIDDYMENLEHTNPDLHSKLSKDLDSLKAKRTTAYVIGSVGTAAGIGLLAAGIVAKFDQKDPFLFGGVGALIVGWFVAYAVYPGRSDIMRFVNKHNTLNPSSPFQWQMGQSSPYQPGSVAPNVVAYTFNF